MLTNKTRLSRATLSQLGALKYIGVLATGYDIVDTAAARERGVVVTNIPTYGTASVAQFAIALLLELCHHAGLHGDAVRNGEWSRNPDWSFWKTPLIELSGKTMGIIGFGRIGRQTGAIAAALGMRVVAHDTAQVNAPDYPGFQWVTLDRIVERSGCVEFALPALAGEQGHDQQGAVGAHEAVSLSVEYVARAAGCGSGSSRCLE